MRMAGAQVDSWCAVGLVMPEGTKLKFRFHIGQELSAASESLQSKVTCFNARSKGVFVSSSPLLGIAVCYLFNGRVLWKSRW